MAFPTALDSFTRWVDGTTIVEADPINQMQMAIEALEAKVGVDSSAVVSSHDYKIAQLETIQIQSDIVKTENNQVLDQDPGTWADIIGATKTLTTKGGNILLIWNSSIVCDTNPTGIKFAFNIDDTEGYGEKNLTLPINFTIPLTLVHQISGLSAASHTFKVQYQMTNPAYYGAIEDSTKGCDSELIVIELPN
jgi:hypothetical protein